MMVGSDCSRIFCFSRLTKTAATRVRSSGFPVSFSTSEARTTSCSGVLIGRSGESAIPDFLEHALLRLLHALDHLLAGHAAIEIVGIGQQAAFARDFLDVAGQYVIVQQARDDLLRGQSLRNRELMRHHATFDDGRHDVAQAGMGLELVFAGFEVVARLEREHAADKDPGLVDNAVAHQHIGRYRECRSREGC